MAKYRLFDDAGNELGEMRLGDAPWKSGDENFLAAGKRLMVLDGVAVEEDGSPFRHPRRLRAVWRSS